jgi:hypothetical protein
MVGVCVLGTGGETRGGAVCGGEIIWVVGGSLDAGGFIGGAAMGGDAPG